MKTKLFFFVFMGSVFSACQTNDTYSSIHAYLESKSKSNSRQGFPLTLVSVQELPRFTPSNGMYILSHAIFNDKGYYYSGDEMAAKIIDLNNQQAIQQISFPDLHQRVQKEYAICFMPDENTFVWHTDSNALHYYNLAGQHIRTLSPQLTYQGKTYCISSGRDARLIFVPQTQDIIIPVHCISEYDSQEEHQLPHIAIYNLNTEQTRFVPISLPTSYNPEVYYAELGKPFISVDGNMLYAMYPLSTTMYRYNLQTEQTDNINISLPVSLTPPGSIQHTTDLYQMAERESRCNRITGMVVTNSKILIQQTDGWNEALASRKYLDNTLLMEFDGNGNLSWSSAFPALEFDGGVFNLSNIKNQQILFRWHNQNNEQRLIAYRYP